MAFPSTPVLDDEHTIGATTWVFNGTAWDVKSFTDANVTKLNTIDTDADVNDPSTTLEGNTFNGTEQLVKTDASGKLPVLDGSNLTNIDTLPTQTGNTGKFLTTNGTVASWSNVSTGINHVTKTGSYTAVTGDYIYTDSSLNIFSITLPATPAENDIVIIHDYNNSSVTNNVIVDRNGETIQGGNTNFIIDENSKFTFVYLDSDWKIFKTIYTENVDSTLQGITSATELNEIDLFINNYAAGMYTASVTGGSYVIYGSSIFWTLPSVITDTTHTLTLFFNGLQIATHDILVLNITTTSDTSVIITDFSLNSNNQGWQI